jgi:hypothetical protein
MRSWGGSGLPWQLWIPTGLLAGAAVLSLRRSPATQILVRAVLWSNLLLAAMVGYVGHGREQLVAAALGASTGLALLALGKRGLEDDRGAFMPVAFRGTLLGLLVMALADAQTLVFWSSLLLEHTSALRPMALAAAGIAIAFAVSVYGLYRLRAWGLVLNSLAAIGLLLVVAAGTFWEARPIAAVLAGSGVLQLALAVPLYRALRRGAEPAPGLRRTSAWLGAAAVGAAIAISVMPAAMHWLRH